MVSCDIFLFLDSTTLPRQHNPSSTAQQFSLLSRVVKYSYADCERAMIIIITVNEAGLLDMFGSLVAIAVFLIYLNLIRCIAHIVCSWLRA